MPASPQIALPDGARIVIRPLRPVDGPALVEGAAHLSARSSYRRFLGTAPAMGHRTVKYLTDVDHHDHEALVAYEPATGEGVGIARFVRDPARPGCAEIAMTVADDWQGRGVGTVLLDALAARARDEGVTTFTGLVLADNAPMLALFGRLGAVRRRHAAAGTLEVEVDLRPAGA